MDLKLPLIAALAAILSLMGAGYARLETTKADRGAVEEIHKDVREIRNYLLGPRK